MTDAVSPDAGAAGGSTRLTYAVADMVAAQRDWWTGSARWQVFLRVAAILFATYGGLMAALAWLLHASLAPMLGIAAGAAPVVTLLLFGIGWALAPLRARRAFRQQRAFAGDYRITWSQAGLEVSGERGTWLMPWSLFHRWLDGRRTLLL